MTDQGPLSQGKCGKTAYYCTLGRGMTPFVTAELAQLDGAEVLKVIEGKIFFTLPDLHGNFNLTTAERVLVLVHHQQQTVELEDRAKASFDLHKILTEVKWLAGLKAWRLSKGKDPASEEQTTARLNVKISGPRMRKFFKPDRLASSLIGRLRCQTNRLAFVVRDQQVSVDVHVSEAFITVGLALSAASRATGGPGHGLRSTTAAAMALCLTLSADGDSFYKVPLSPGDCVLDPMCGQGAVLTALLNRPLVVLGVDCEQGQLGVASANNPRAAVVLGDARRLPFATDSVDHVVCDLPFGLKYNQSDFKQVIPNVMLEMDRVLKDNGRMVLLFAKNEQKFLESCVSDGNFKLIKTYNISLGMLEATVFVYLKCTVIPMIVEK